MRRIGKLKGALRRFLGGYRRVVLLYHRVADAEADPWALCVSPRRFAEQMDVLRRRGGGAALGDVVEGIGRAALPAQVVAVTFDDGYADNLHAAKPVLKRHGIPATCFLTTGPVGRAREFWWDELERILLRPGALPDAFELPIGRRIVRRRLGASARYGEAEARRHSGWRAWHRPPGPRQALYRDLWRVLLPLSDVEQQEVMEHLAAWADASRDPRPSHRTLSDEEASTLVSSGLIELGAHSETHPLLPTLSVAAQREELRRSKLRCETIGGARPLGFAYPYGRHNRQTVALAREVGFAYACTNVPLSVGSRTDRFRLPRVEVRDWTGEEFARRLFERG